jgi:hypothetical protein
MARTSTLLFLTSVTVLLSGCQPGPLDDAVSRNDVKVLDALLRTSCKVETKEIISDLPATPYGITTAHGAKHDVRFGLDLAARPAHRARWPKKKMCKTARVVPDAEIQRAFANDTQPPMWIEFGKAFDGALHLMRVSLPVYSPDGSRAVVYTSGTCPFVCGAGFYHELRRTGFGEWEITRSENAWKAS